MSIITEIIGKYTAGEITLEQAYLNLTHGQVEYADPSAQTANGADR